MVGILCQLNPKLYTEFVTLENGRKVLYTEASKSMYGMVDSVFLFWLHLSGFLEEQGFELNPYDICCMNKEIDGTMCTIVWHADDIKASHVDPKVIDTIIGVLQEKFGKHAPLTFTRGKVHDYLGMCIDLSIKGKVMITMIDMIIKMFELLPDKMKAEIKKGCIHPHVMAYSR